MKQPPTPEQLQNELAQIRARTLQLQRLVTDLRHEQARCSRAILELSSPPQKGALKT